MTTQVYSSKESICDYNTKTILICTCSGDFNVIIELYLESTFHLIIDLQQVLLLSVTFKCTHAAVFYVIAKLHLESSILLIINDRLTILIDIVINNDEANTCWETSPEILELDQTYNLNKCSNKQ